IAKIMGEEKDDAKIINDIVTEQNVPTLHDNEEKNQPIEELKDESQNKSADVQNEISPEGNEEKKDEVNPQ
ncbi:MAG: hypothetical protein AABW64_04590, partial [Nanoarchaeota archaeon]